MITISSHFSYISPLQKCKSTKMCKGINVLIHEFMSIKDTKVRFSIGLNIQVPVSNGVLNLRSHSVLLRYNCVLVDKAVLLELAAYTQEWCSGLYILQ